MFHTSRPSTSGSRKFAVDFSDGYGGFQMADYPSSSSQGSFSSGQGSPPLHAAEYSEQTRGLTSPQSSEPCSSKVTGPLRSVQKRGLPEGGDLIHLDNGLVLHDLGGCSAPRKKAIVNRPKKVAASRKKSTRVSPRSNHPPWIVAILKAWVAAHVKDPYPKGPEKFELAKATTLRVQQVDDWFVNERRRNWNKYGSGGSPVLHKVGKGNRRRISKENRDPQLASRSSSKKKVNQGASGPGWNAGTSRKNSASPSSSSGSGWNASSTMENSARSLEKENQEASGSGWNAGTSMENTSRPLGNPVSFVAESLVMLTAKHYPDNEDDGSVPLTEDSPDPLMIHPPFHGLVWVFEFADKLNGIPNSESRAEGMCKMIYREVMSDH